MGGKRIVVFCQQRYWENMIGTADREFKGK